MSRRLLAASAVAAAVTAGTVLVVQPGEVAADTACSSRTLKYGQQKNACVGEMQKLLNVYCDDSSGFSGDGNFGKRTRAAVIQAQRKMGGVRTDGVVDRATWAALRAEKNAESSIDCGTSTGGQPPNPAATETSTATSTAETTTSTSAAGSMGARALEKAKTKQGRPYVWGAKGPNSFDCSGLVYWSYRQLGKTLPPNSLAQSQVGTKVERKDLQPGDLLFFTRADTGKKVGHVGFYDSNGQLFNASTSSKPVGHSKINWSRFVVARRI